MKDFKYDPKLADEAKKKAAGPLGREMSKFPLLFAKPAFFGQRPSPKRETKIINGTITLINLGKGNLGITCQHVIEFYRKYREDHEEVAFNIGNVELDPIAQLVDENAKTDLAVIELTDKQIDEITSDGEIGSQVFKPGNWPPGHPKKEEFVAFGGFPGVLRKKESINTFGFASWSSGATRIDSVSENRFISPFEREYWIKSFGEEDKINLKVLGGMSGGPAFICRKLHFEFVGIVSEYEKSYDAVIFASVQSINQNGTIASSPL